jgi:hypothetical protein
MRYVCARDQAASRLAEFGYSGRDFAAMSSSGAQDKRLKYQDYRFSVAPMMDWTDRPEKAKPNQHLRRTRFVVQYQMLYRPTIKRLVGERFRVPTFVWRPPSIAAYYSNLRDCTPSNERGALSLFIEVWRL